MVDELDRGRAAFRAQAWDDAYTRLSDADDGGELAPADLELLARSAYLTGRDSYWEEAWARAHRGFLERGDVERAARSAFWLGLVLFNRGEEERGGGWIGRACRVLTEGAPRDCVEHGYLLLPAALQQLGGGAAEQAYELCGRALDVAERFDEPDLRALGRLGRGQALIGMDEPHRAVPPAGRGDGGRADRRGVHPGGRDRLLRRDPGV